MAYVVNTRACQLVLNVKSNPAEFFQRFAIIPKQVEEIPDEVLEFFEANPENAAAKTWQSWKDQGYIRILRGDEPVPAEAQAPNSLAEYGEDAAEALVSVEDDLTILRQWLKVERRKEVKAVIKDRITKLAA